MRDLEYKAPELCNVLELAMIIPNGTSEIERKFKTLKDMKLKKQNRLSSEKVNMMFLINHLLNLESYDEEQVYKIF